MTQRKYFGTDGIRGKVGESNINPEFVTKLGWAAGKVLAGRGTNKVLIGKDTRISGYMLESSLEHARVVFRGWFIGCWYQYRLARPHANASHCLSHQNISLRSRDSD